MKSTTLNSDPITPARMIRLGGRNPELKTLNSEPETLNFFKH
jgi:hypothetical protein